MRCHHSRNATNAIAVTRPWPHDRDHRACRVITLHCQPTGERATEIWLGAGAATALARRAVGRRGFALIDDAVANNQRLELSTTTFHQQLVRGGEHLKTLTTAEAILRAMVNANCDRGSVLLAIGGGSVGDLGGFCASLFARGIELWHAPTSMLSMVDSSVGGKTAVNLPEGKNLIGTVHPATLVAIDPAFVRSEPETGFRSGLAEAIKMGLGLDAELFALLERQSALVLQRDDELITDVVHRSLAAKIAVIEQDPRETGRRRLLNLGHTLGHALEAVLEGRTRHGICVARGLWFALDVARELSSMSKAELARAEQLLRRYGFERTALPSIASLMTFLAHDKKVIGNVVHFALPTGIGRSEPRAIELSQLAKILSQG
ncbi:MAG: 3-dehydroquinate synthase [Planctomycetota bacterium]|jgi:3-dehydroquinate synthetase|nr:3-dehydroquinate synthase [Planctomycetota bacterium]MSR38910.1 3-dehydroquinate synthase [Planctomycetota bacterium]